MAQTKILVDTNSYFRLAQNLHPLMKTPFWDAHYTLYAHKDLKWELDCVARMETKLQWIHETKYIENRNRSVSIPSPLQSDIENTFEHMWEYAKDECHDPDGKGPGETDTLILSTALVLDIFVITDDQAMMAWLMNLT